MLAASAMRLICFAPASVIDRQGRATGVATDYRVTLPDNARTCVEQALRTRPYPLATSEGLTVTYRYLFNTYGL